MAPEDMQKTYLFPSGEEYIYRVMPFRLNFKKKLKKAGVTYQRAATILLHDMMHKKVEVYVDNIT